MLEEEVKKNALILINNLNPEGKFKRSNMYFKCQLKSFETQ